MNMPIRFDVIEYTKVLMESGLPRDQSEAHALALAKALSEGSVSSGELVLARQEFLMRMDVLKQELLARIGLMKEELRAELMPKINLALWLSSLSLVVSLINSAMLAYLIASHHV
jgi:hypothetical protein